MLADFTNLTGDPELDGLTDVFIPPSYDSNHVNFLSPSLNILAPDRVGDILTQMKRSPHEHLTPELAREVCLRANAKAVVTGSVSVNGTHYKITVSAINCQTGQTLGTAEGEADTRADVSKVSRDVTSQLIRKLMS